MNNHKPDPSVLPCIGCRGAFPDCHNACGDLDAHHAWQDRQQLNETVAQFSGICGHTPCPAEDVFVREVAG